MQCTDCKLQGISCPYTYMVVPEDKTPIMKWGGD